jgi:hypothetical protein
MPLPYSEAETRQQIIDQRLRLRLRMPLPPLQLQKDFASLVNTTYQLRNRILESQRYDDYLMRSHAKREFSKGRNNTSDS